jgi:ABC-type proline/glycine betaine transport system permease subunit
MTRKEWAKTAGVLALEIFISNIVGTLAAFGVAIPLLLYAFRHQKQARAVLPSVARGRVLMSLAIFGVVVAFGIDGWRAYVAPPATQSPTASQIATEVAKRIFNSAPPEED